MEGDVLIRLHIDIITFIFNYNEAFASQSVKLILNAHSVYKTLVNVQTSNYKITNTSLYSNNVCAEYEI